MNESRQYTFINNKNGFTISLNLGNSLMSEIQKIHNIGPHAFDFYRKSVMGATQLVNFLKPGENLGFYIDSEEPFFRFKIEISHHGALRTLLLPEDFSNYPTAITGKCRINKVVQNKAPYTSILSYEDFPIENIVNDCLEKSYQTKSQIIFSDNFINSLLLSKLPPSNIDKKIEDFNDLTTDQIMAKFSNIFTIALEKEFEDIKELESFLNNEGFHYLGSKELKFHCPCSKERMINNLHTLKQEDIDDIFKEQSAIETRCDYCNSIYEIKKEEIITNIQ